MLEMHVLTCRQVSVQYALTSQALSHKTAAQTLIPALLLQIWNRQVRGAE